MTYDFFVEKSRLDNVERGPEDDLLLGASLQRILKFERCHGIVVPAVLKDWLGVVNGTCVGGGGLMGLDTRLRVLDIDTTLMLNPSWKGKGWIPVACDGSGNYFVIAPDGMTHVVAFIDIHEDSDSLTYLVASSLPVFINKFIDYQCAETAWPFDRASVLADDPAMGQLSIAPFPWD